jgi:hypothetical protein
MQAEAGWNNLVAKLSAAPIPEDKLAVLRGLLGWTVATGRRGDTPFTRPGTFVGRWQGTQFPNPMWISGYWEEEKNENNPFPDYTIEFYTYDALRAVFVNVGVLAGGCHCQSESSGPGPDRVMTFEGTISSPGLTRPFRRVFRLRDDGASVTAEVHLDQWKICWEVEARTVAGFASDPMGS